MKKKRRLKLVSHKNKARDFKNKLRRSISLGASKNIQNMVIILKIILLLVSVLSYLLGRFFVSDYKNYLKSESFNEATLWERLLTRTILFSVVFFLACVNCFIIYFEISKITLSSFF